jgi:hypothetical protein
MGVLSIKCGFFPKKKYYAMTKKHLGDRECNTKVAGTYILLNLL